MKQRRPLFQAYLVLFTCVLLAFELLIWRASEAKLNVVVIFVSGLGSTLGIYGDQRAVTPNLDQLGSISSVFLNAFGQFFTPGPSRVSMLTSRYPDTLECYQLGCDTMGFGSIASHLWSKGYHIEELTPSKTDILTVKKSALKYFGSRPQEPFFMTVELPLHQSKPRFQPSSPSNRSHPFLVLGPEDPSCESATQFYLRVTHLDHVIGEILQSVLGTHLGANTIVSVVSDSVELPCSTPPGYNPDLGLQVPWMVFHPLFPQNFQVIHPTKGLPSSNELQPRQTIFGVTQLLDVVPTLVELAGLEAVSWCSEPHEMGFCTEGTSRASTIVSGREFFSREYAVTQATQSNPRGDIERMGYSLRGENYRFVEWLPFQENVTFDSPMVFPDMEVYDLRDNPEWALDPETSPKFDHLSKWLQIVMQENYRPSLY